MYVGIIIIERDGTRVKWVRDEEFRAHDMFRFLSDRGDEVIATFDAILHYGSVVEAIAQMSGRPASGYELLRSGTETVSANDYNTIVSSMIDDLNQARPITAGGTGATSAPPSESSMAPKPPIGPPKFFPDKIGRIDKLPRF